MIRMAVVVAPVIVGSAIVVVPVISKAKGRIPRPSPRVRVVVPPIIIWGPAVVWVISVPVVGVGGRFIFGGSEGCGNSLAGVRRRRLGPLRHLVPHLSPALDQSGNQLVGNVTLLQCDNLRSSEIERGLGGLNVGLNDLKIDLGIQHFHDVANAGRVAQLKRSDWRRLAGSGVRLSK